MTEPATPNPERRRRLDAALAEYLLAADAGRAPDPRAWAARYPGRQPELGEFLADQAGLDRLVAPLRPAPAHDRVKVSRRAPEETARAAGGPSDLGPAGGHESTQALTPDPTGDPRDTE